MSLLDFFRRNRRSYTEGEAAKFLIRAENLNWAGEDCTEAINYLLKSGRLRKIKTPLFRNKLTV